MFPLDGFFMVFSLVQWLYFLLLFSADRASNIIYPENLILREVSSFSFTLYLLHSNCDKYSK